MADNYKRRLGDRRDGRRLRTLNPFDTFIPYIMRDRNDAMNMFRDSIEISDTDRWLRDKRAEGYKGLGFLHVFIASYIRVLTVRPGLNRFIAGQKIYARNSIEVVMAVKRALTVEGSETTIKVEFDIHDTVFDVYRKMNAAIDEIKADTGDNGTEKAAAILGKIPGLLLKFAIVILRIMDYFGWLPGSLVKVSPFHGSMIVTDMGSLGIPPIYHHLYNFGNLPIFLSFGAKRSEVELDRSGEPVKRKYVDFCVVTDERICDGYYYASSFKYMKHYMRNPKLLESAPTEITQDVF